ncbi:MAG: FliM/FliN family flagellar motor switch protein, partial [Deltaproteobacteria bacterium]|nr:FliM/FliN family flagellar motor switch protein [Deltaproteobacteria bacterium]
GLDAESAEDNPLDLDEVPEELPPLDDEFSLEEELGPSGDNTPLGDELEIELGAGPREEDISLEGFGDDEDMDLDAMEEGDSAEPQEERSEFYAVPDVDLEDIELDTLDNLGDVSEGDAGGDVFYAADDVDLDNLELETLEKLDESPVMGGDLDDDDIDLSHMELDDMDGLGDLGEMDDEPPLASAASMAARDSRPEPPAQQARPERPASDVLELSPEQEPGMPPAKRSPLGLERELLLSVPRRVNVELGSVALKGTEILDLAYGSIVQLEQTVGEPVDLVMEGRKIARGEVVVINGRSLGVRILELQK